MPHHLTLLLVVTTALAAAGSALAAGKCRTLSPADCAPHSCTAAIAAALQDCSAAGGGTVALTAGSFPLDAAVSLCNLHSVTLQGSLPATTLLITGNNGALSFCDSTDIRVASLAIDMQRAPYTYGPVIGIDPTNSAFTIRYDPARYPFQPSYPWLAQCQALLQYDNEHLRPAVGGVDIYATDDPLPVVVDTTNNTLTIQRVPDIKSIQMGEYFIARHLVYGANGISGQNVSRLHVDHVRLFSNPGMGVVFQLSSDISLDHVYVSPKDGYPMSLSADATHFMAAQGTIAITNSIFERQGDDGLNVHGKYYAVASLPAANQVLSSPPPHGGSLDFQPGEMYEFRSRRSFQPTMQARLTAVLNATSGLLAFDRAIPAASVAPFDLFYNIQRQPSVHIRNCTYGSNRARGALLKTSNVLVEDSTFEYTSGPGIQVAPDGCYWFESNAIQGNWTIRNATLRDVNYGAAMAAGDIYLAACVPTWQDGKPTTNGGPPTTGQVFRGITIEQVSFFQSLATPHPAVTVYGVDTFALTSNTVTRTSAAARDAASTSDFFVSNSIHCSTQDNVCSPSPCTFDGNPCS